MTPLPRRRPTRPAEPAGAERPPELSGPGAVLVDIGGEVGAAVVTATHGLAGREIEIRRAGDEWRGRHVAFHRRETFRGTVTAAVFPQLPAGRWEARLCSDPDSPVVTVEVPGGRAVVVPFPG